MELKVRAIKPDDFKEFKEIFSDKKADYDNCLFCNEKATKVTESADKTIQIRSCDEKKCLKIALNFVSKYSI